MPVEIRELIIKTEIKIENTTNVSSLNEDSLAVLKDELLDMCKRIFSDEIKKTTYRR